jgi:hypothetical protein
LEEEGILRHFGKKSRAFSPKANYTDWATSIGLRIFVPTIADRGCDVFSPAEPPQSLISVFYTGAAPFSFK